MNLTLRKISSRKYEKIGLPSKTCYGIIFFVRIILYFDQDGQIPEWPKGTDCKSAANCFGGSNPPLPMNETHAKACVFFVKCQIKSNYSVTMKKLFTGSAGGGLAFNQLWTKQRLADGNMMNQRI